MSKNGSSKSKGLTLYSYYAIGSEHRDASEGVVCTAYSYIAQWDKERNWNCAAQGCPQDTVSSSLAWLGDCGLSTALLLQTCALAVQTAEFYFFNFLVTAEIIG